MTDTDKQYLSTKAIPVNERLIVALDVPTVQAGEDLVSKLGDSVVFYKLGLQIFMAGGYYELIDRLIKQGKKAFVDLKFFDVPETVKSAVQQLTNRHVTFATVHGNDNILRAAVEVKNGLKILAVTVLTSLDRSDLKDLGFDCSVEDLVLSRARRALGIGCDGVISSGLESVRLRRDLGENFLIVSPGIRPVDNDRPDDQKRTVSVEQAFLNGADYIVVGRPILKADDPKAEAESHQRRIAAVFK
jgi:orotidine-5'-phosphate decarboxylase